MPYHAIPCHTMPCGTWNSRSFAFSSSACCAPAFFQAANCRGVWGSTVLPWTLGASPAMSDYALRWSLHITCNQIWYNAPLITPVTKVVDARMLHDARRLDGSCLPSRFTILLISLTRMRKQVAEKTGFRNFFSRFNLNLRIQLSQDWYGLIAPNPITRVQLDRSCSHHGTKPPGCHDPEPARTIWNHSKHLNPQDSEPLQPQQFARYRLPQGGSCGAEWYGNVINLERVAYDSQLWCLALLIWGSENWSVFGSISFKAARFSCEGCGSVLWNYLALEASGTLMEEPIQNLSPHCLSKSLSESLPWNWRLRVGLPFIETLWSNTESWGHLTTKGQEPGEFQITIAIPNCAHIINMCACVYVYAGCVYAVCIYICVCVCIPMNTGRNKCCMHSKLEKKEWIWYMTFGADVLHLCISFSVCMTVCVHTMRTWGYK